MQAMQRKNTRNPEHVEFLLREGVDGTVDSTLARWRSSEMLRHPSGMWDNISKKHDRALDATTKVQLNLDP
jgi:hypothetical protein